MVQGLRSVYDAIADSWSHKTEPFNFFVDFVNNKNGFFFVDGCGAGRHSCLIKPVVGIDFSFNMIKLARDKDPKGFYLVADVRALPFKDKVFDYSASLAVLHHLMPSDCLIALKELKRVTKSESLISVWLHPEFRGESLIKFGSQKRFYYLFEPKEFYQLVNKVFKEINIIPDDNNIVFSVI